MSARHLAVKRSQFSVRYRPKADALWKSPQVTTASAEPEPTLATPSNTAPTLAAVSTPKLSQDVVILSRLGPDAWAELLRFTELHSLGSVAVVCTMFCKCTFEDIRFWLAYAGVGAQPCALTTNISPSIMRNSIRRVAFGLEGAWGKAFADFASIHTNSEVFTQAIRMFSGIRSTDDELETARFVGVLVGKLGTFDASCMQTRKVAEALVQKAKECELNLPRAAMPFARAAPPLKRLNMALQASIEHSETKCSEEGLISNAAVQPQKELLQEDKDLEDDMEDVATEITTCDDRILKTGLVAAATAAGALATSFLSEELFVDEGMQELTMLAALIPAGFVYARRRQQAATQKASAVVNKFFPVRAKSE